MRKAKVFLHDRQAGFLIEEKQSETYCFIYLDEYNGPPISVTMPINQQNYKFDRFPPLFEGLLPEGVNLEMLLRTKKIDRNDSFSQLMAVGKDTVGAITVQEIT